MKIRRALRRTFGSRTFRGEVLGCLVELRIGSGGGEIVLVDGALLSRKPWAYLTGQHEHYFGVEDADGETRNVEVRVEDRSGGLQAALRVVVNVDGEAFTVLPEVDAPARYTRCGHCGYDLHGLEAQNHEVRCPECGRHTSAKLLG